MDETQTAAPLALPRPKRDFSRATPYDPDYCERLVEYFESAPLVQQGERVTQILESDEPASGRKGKGSLKREVRAICAEMPTFEKFGQMIFATTQTMLRWEAKYVEWAEACTHARDVQRNWLYQTGMSDRVQPAAWEFVATNVTRFQLRRQQSLIVEHQETIDPRPELASIPAAALELMREISQALKAGLDPEDYAGFRAVLAAKAERALSGPVADLGPSELASELASDENSASPDAL